MSRLYTENNFKSENNLDKCKCCICLDVVYLAKTSDNCPHVFCTECIDVWHKKDTKCPECKIELKLINSKYFDLINIYNLKYHCLNEGCDYIDVVGDHYRNITNHNKECKFKKQEIINNSDEFKQLIYTINTPPNQIPSEGLIYIFEDIPPRRLYKYINPSFRYIPPSPYPLSLNNMNASAIINTNTNIRYIPSLPVPFFNGNSNSSSYRNNISVEQNTDRIIVHNNNKSMIRLLYERIKCIIFGDGD